MCHIRRVIEIGNGEKGEETMRRIKGLRGDKSRAEMDFIYLFIFIFVTHLS